VLKGFNVQKTLLGLSSVFVSVPDAKVKLCPSPLSSFTELSSLNKKKPLFP